MRRQALLDMHRIHIYLEELTRLTNEDGSDPLANATEAIGEFANKLAHNTRQLERLAINQPKHTARGDADST